MPVGAARQDGGVRSPTRTLAAATLCFEALVVLFAGLVAKELSSLSEGAAVGLAAGLAVACFVTAGLLRHPAGYVLGSVLQVAVVASGFWVPAMFFLGGVFAVLWYLALRLGRRAEAEARARWAEQQAGPGADHAADRGTGQGAER
jgi:hypothetical protein